MSAATIEAPQIASEPLAIESEAQRMSRLVDDLLLLARLDDARPLEHLPVALDELVEQAVETARVVDPGRLFQFDGEEHRRSALQALWGIAYGTKARALLRVGRRGT